LIKSNIGTLYLVSTPIGNLEDITFRAVEILKGVNLIAAEDTRRSKILLSRYNIKTKMISYYEHNKFQRLLKIEEVLKDNYDVAVITSGLPTDRFIFEGFLPPKKGRKKIIENLKDVEATIIFYENSNRLKRTVKQLFEILGDRPAVICREITKIYEEIIRGTLSSLLEILETKTYKGECVLLVSKDDKNIYFD